MRKLLKFILFIVIANFLVFAGLLLWFGFTSIVPSLKASGITFKELLSKDIDPSKKTTFEMSVAEKSSVLGKKAAVKLINGLKVIMPSPRANLSKMPEEPYPYPSIDEVIRKNNKAAEKGISDGMKYLKDSENYYENIKKKALEDENKE